MWATQLDSGNWRGAFRDGSGKQHTKTFPYEHQALSWAEQGEREAFAAADGIDLVGAKGQGPLIATYGDEYLQRRAPFLAASTNGGYAIAFRAIKDSKQKLGMMRVDGIRRSDVERWIAAQVKDGVGRPTINYRLKLLRMILRDALAEGHTNYDATHGVRFLTTDIRPDRTLSDVELGALLAEADRDLKIMILLAVDAGLRYEEAAGLGVDCIDDDSIVVRQVALRDGTIRGYPKSKLPRRVPMPTRLKAALVPYAAERRLLDGPQAIVIVRENNDGERVPLGYENFRHRTWKKATHAAGLSRGKLRVRFHDLRHTYGTRLAHANVPRRQIADWMGHADESTTARYIHSAEESSAVLRLRSALG